MDPALAQELVKTLDSLYNAAILWSVTPFALLVLLILALAALARSRAKSQKKEKWLENELAQLRRQIENAQQPQAAKPVKAPPARLRRDDVPARSGPDLVSVVNGLLTGNQPYNFIESVRALDPQLNLQRLTPRPGSGAFTQDVVLEGGGDGLFACVSGNSAFLFPNYSRFSATLDPKPLFDGARHGGRIHSIASPAILARMEDGAWLVMEKGRVLMRQRSE